MAVELLVIGAAETCRFHAEQPLIGADLGQLDLPVIKMPYFGQDCGVCFFRHVNDPLSLALLRMPILPKRKFENNRKSI